MHIVYLITHIERLKNNTPPYFYIGSKYKWKGEGTYFGSSRHPLMKEASPSDLKFEVIWQNTVEMTSSELLLVEKQIQIDNDVCRSNDYFNLSIACASLFHRDVVDKRLKTFSNLANSLDENGVALKYKWATKGKESFNRVKESGLTRREECSIFRKEWMLSEHSSGQTVASYIKSKTLETNLKLDEYGLNQYQRNGIKIAKTLSQINPETGNTLAYDRVESRRNRIEIIGVCFYSCTEAKEFLKCDDKTLNNITKNNVSVKTYNLLCKLFSKEYIDDYITPVLYRSKKLIICGKEFEQRKLAEKTLKIPRTAFDNFILRDAMSEKVKDCLISYFGLETFNQYYA